jgi:hypothetical protein
MPGFSQMTHPRAWVAVSAPGDGRRTACDRPVTELRWQAHSPSVIWEA